MRYLITMFSIWILFLAGLSYCEGVQGQMLSDFDTRLIRFNQVWNTFYRTHFNCPVDAHYLEECRVDANSNKYDGFPKVVKEFTKSFVGESK